MKHILHIDINSFFASVEELLNPHYANHPIIVAGRTKRSVVSSANYLARSYGVKAAMPLHLALRLCPNAIIARPHFDVYRNYADKFFNIIAVDFTNRIEVSSIDECYVDITHLIKEHITPYQIAKKIQNTILSKIKLRCSIGIGPNKFLAKMGSDYKKPFGITSIYQEDLPTKIWPQPIDDMIWIGKATATLLKKHGIKTIGDIAKSQNKQIIESLLDKNWIVHYQRANGYDSDELDYAHNAPKSIGASETFLEDTSDWEEIKLKLVELVKNVVERLQEYQMQTKTISINIKYPNFVSQNRSLTIDHHTDDYEIILLRAIKLYHNNFLDQNVRLVGVSLSHLLSNDKLTVNSELFDDYVKTDINVINKNEISVIVNEINRQFARNIITTADKKNKLR